MKGGKSTSLWTVVAFHFRYRKWIILLLPEGYSIQRKPLTNLKHYKYIHAFIYKNSIYKTDLKQNQSPEDTIDHVTSTWSESHLSEPDILQIR